MFYVIINLFKNNRNYGSNCLNNPVVVIPRLIIYPIVIAAFELSVTTGVGTNTDPLLKETSPETYKLADTSKLGFNVPDSLIRVKSSSSKVTSSVTPIILLPSPKARLLTV